MAAGAVTVNTFRQRKRDGGRIAMLTAYDALMARLLDEAGVDALLVGDSLGMVVQGRPNTLSVTLDQMVYHTGLVARGASRAMVIADMPFMSYQVSPEQAVKSAGRLIQEGGAAAVKLEGGREMVETVRRIAACGIPVVGHLGLTPQSIHSFGGFVVQGRASEQAGRIREDAQALAEAGIFCLVLESVPHRLAAEITAALPVPTVGIGAGPGCDGQVLVCTDMLGLDPGFNPRFLKKYADLHAAVTGAARSYVADVGSGAFPTLDHSFE